MEVIARLEEQSDDDISEVVDIFMEPPAADEGVTDEDSDKSDGEYEFNVNHLGRKLLSAGCEVRKSSRIRQRKQAACENSDTEDDPKSADGNSCTQHPPAPAPSNEPPPQKKAKTDKQRDTPVWTKKRHWTIFALRKRGIAGLTSRFLCLRHPTVIPMKKSLDQTAMKVWLYTISDQ